MNARLLRVRAKVASTIDISVTAFDESVHANPRRPKQRKYIFYITVITKKKNRMCVIHTRKTFAGRVNK